LENKLEQMKKILIPTDFSQNAKKATDYALSLFDEKDTSITLLNVFYIPYAAPDVAYSVSDVTYDNSKQLFEKEQQRIREKFPNLKSTITTDFSIGDLVSVVCTMEKKEEFDLIVMGTKGASGLAEVFVGSRTSSMIQSVKTPVLAIPEEAKFTAPKRILFAADEELIDHKVNLEVLKEIANKHQSKIDALYISENDENKEIIEKFINYELDLNFVDIPHELRMKRGNNVEEAIKNYTENYPIDLVAMITTKGNLFYNIFHESVTKKVAMHTKMPLLVMHTN
jgi:nucleotide-binding universal stress UspA family protein